MEGCIQFNFSRIADHGPVHEERSAFEQVTHRDLVLACQQKNLAGVKVFIMLDPTD